MKILYLAKHNNPFSNDDEGGIAGSLRELGHEVQCIDEQHIQLLDRPKVAGDIILFHHCKSFSFLQRNPIPKVFWCFDRIYWDSPRMSTRNAQRVEWINKATEISKLGFCTDGDWVQQDKTGKLVWLMQGFNQYLPRVKNHSTNSNKILFTGGGRDYGRDEFVSEMRQKYGDRFVHVPKGAYKQKLISLIEDSAIVVAPPSPVTNRYWSNRLYVIMGMGGFLLHPHTLSLEEDFLTEELHTYGRMDHLHQFIGHFSTDIEMREYNRVKGQAQILVHHTYKDRCQTLITTIRERLGI